MFINILSKIAAGNILPTYIIILIYSAPNENIFMAPKKKQFLKGVIKQQKERFIGTEERAPFPLDTLRTNLVVSSEIQGNVLTIIFIIL